MDDQRQSTGTIREEKRISDAESALYERFISRLDEGRYDECRQIAGLMERLSII